MCKWFVKLFTASFSLYHSNLITGDISKSEECPAMMNGGCMATVTVTGGMESWARACCMSALCLNDHTSVGGMEMWNER